MGMLIGREHELALIAGLADAARTGQAGALLLVGDAGVGKTSLLAEAADRARELTVAHLTAIAPEQTIPFAGLSMLLARADPTHLELPAPQQAALDVALA